MHALDIEEIGDGVGLRLPREVLSRLGVGAGDKLYLTETAEGYRLTSLNPELEAQKATARRLMRSRQRALHQLSQG